MAESKEIQILVPWGHIAGKTYGSPNDFPVLLLHGLMDNADSFHRLITHLPSNNYYVAIDLPGHGWSSHFPAGLSLNFYNYVLAIRYVVEELKWTEFHLIGQSIGAQLSLFYSFIYPGRVQRLIVIEGFYPRILREHQLLPYIQESLELAAKHQKEEIRTYTRDEVMYLLRCKRKFALNSAAAEAVFERSVTEIGNEIYRFNRDPRLKNDLLPLLSLDQFLCLTQSMDTKILAVFTHSSANIFSPQFVHETQKLVESFFDIKLFFIEGNHDVHNNHPERVAPYIAEFFSNYNLTCKL